MSTILIITRNYPPAICGVGDHTAHLKRELVASGNKVVVVTGTAGQAETGIFSVASFNGSMHSKLKTLIAEEKIDRILWQYVPYSYQRKGLPFWWPLLMLRLAGSGVKQFIFFHEVSLRWWGYGLRQLVVASGQRMIANLASLVASGSFTSIPLYAGYFIFKKPGIVPISANISLGGQWSITSGQEQVAHQPSTVDAFHIFCFANRADKALLEAMKNIGVMFPVKLVLGGMIRPDKKAQLVDWIGDLNLKDTVSFTGTLAPDALAAIIDGSAIFIQPQIVERRNQGGISAKNGTVMAAMAMGKAIITCAGDMTDPAIFKPETNMLLVPYGDVAAYERAILKLLQNPVQAIRLGLTAENTYNEYCSWEVTGGRIMAGLGAAKEGISTLYGPPVTAAGGI